MNVGGEKKPDLEYEGTSDIWRGWEVNIEINFAEI
jgi:hypothetical protein